MKTRILRPSLLVIAVSLLSGSAVSQTAMLGKTQASQPPVNVQGTSAPVPNPSLQLHFGSKQTNQLPPRRT